MNRHFWRACDRRPQSGVTLVELLVAIIIATIFFAAAVPFFVSAIQTTSRDRMHVVAVNAAQDRIEQIHNLDYDLVSKPYLGTTLGTTWQVKTAAGQRDLNVSYAVTPSAASATSAGYKVVTLTVGWAGNPAPLNPVVLSTVIYAQFAGPQITNFTITPYDSSTDELTSASVALTATINAADIASMATTTIAGQTAMGHVTFTIASATGTVYPATTVNYGALGTTPSSYPWSWTVPGGSVVGAVDGYYTFTATAYSSSGQPGNTWTIRKRIETGPPAAVTNLNSSATKDMDGVTLTWTPSISGDVVHYVVTRTGGGSFTPVTLPVTATGYADSTAVANTDYTYIVTAVDWLDNQTGASTGVVWGALLPAPNPATNLTASQAVAAAPTVSLTWSAPASIPYPLGGYDIYADGDGNTIIATSNTTSATITSSELPTLTWSSPHTFQVKPFLQSNGLAATSWATFAVGQASQYGWALVTIGSQPPATPYTLNVLADFNPQNKNDTATITLEFLGATDTGSGRTVGTESNVAANTTVSWSSLQAGWYRVSYATQKLNSSKDIYLTGLPYTQIFNMI